MAYSQLQKPANQICNNETAHWPMKYHGEHKQSDYNVVKCQTQCQAEKYAQHGYGSGTHGYANSHTPGTYTYPNGHGGAYPNGHGTAYPNGQGAATHYPLNGHSAVTPGHSSGQMAGTCNSQHYGHGAGAAGHGSYGTAACY
ncbi:hypothetical protein CRG98_001719, partial [Punica granatum]